MPRNETTTPGEIDHIGQLVPDPQNARAHNPRNVGMLEESLQEVGAWRSIAIDEHNVILAGNATVEAAGSAGIEKVRVIDAAGDEIIAVRRSGLTEDQKRRYALFDNRTAELATWDPVVIGGLVGDGVDLSTFFREDEMAAILAGLDDGAATEDGGTVGDRNATPAVPEEAVSVPGDVWLLGPKHRLAVGDCTEIGTLDRLMRGEVADLIVTDPPYGVAYEGTATKERDAIENDNLGDEGTRQLVRDALATAPLKPGGVFYVCSPPGNTETAFRLAVADAGLQLRQCLVWVKQQFVLGRQDYHWRHESILYGWKDGAAHYFVDERTHDTVWEIDRPSRSEEHPTMKPPGLFQKCVSLSSKPDEIVLDLFAGSGTIFIACEATGRQGRGVELNPVYADVIVQRYCDFVDGDATREADGASWRALNGQKKGGPGVAADPVPETDEADLADLPF